jgi:hypothetical protein
MNIITNNPYRLLGVYANSRKQEIIANKRKATAFLKIGRNVDFPLDLNGLLAPLSRTVELLDEAEARLAIAKEQIKYAQFWFLKLSPQDEVAFNHLIAGNVSKAKEIWSMQESLSSLQNKLVCSIIEKNYGQTLQLAENLYTKFGNDYIYNIDANSTLRMSSVELLHHFIDSLSEEIEMMSLIDNNLGTETKKYINSKNITPLINIISTEVEKAKKVDHNNPKRRIEAAQSLIANTKEALNRLKSILPSTDTQYQMITDKLGIEILQCGIDYFNHSENDDDAPYTALKIQKYAQSIVTGNLAKQRCDENVKILEKIISELPPKEVVGDNNAILNRLNSYSNSPKNISNAISLLNGTKQHIQNIKAKLGAKDAFYLKLSTLVVSQALHGVVVEINASQKPIEENIGFMDYELSSYFLKPEQRQKIIDRLKKALSDAWDAIIIMDRFDLDTSFKQHYYQNRKTIKSMGEQFGVISSWEPIPAGGFAEYGGFWSYIKSEKSSRWQAALIVTIIGGLIGFLIYYNNPNIYDVDEKFKCIAWGTGIGAIAWICIFVDDENKSGDWGDLAARGGCYGVVLFLGLFLFYWVYKVIRLSIDGIKKI